MDEQEINLLLNKTSRDEYGEEQYKWNELDKCTFSTINLLMKIYRDLFFLLDNQHDELLKTFICVITQSNVPREQKEREYDGKTETLIEYPNNLKTNYVDRLVGALKFFIQNSAYIDSNVARNRSSIIYDSSFHHKSNTFFKT